MALSENPQHPLFAFPPEQEEALSRWTSARWKKEAGFAIRLRGQTLFGGDGQWRLQNFGAGLAITGALASAAILSSAGGPSSSLGFFWAAPTLFFGSQLGPSLANSLASARSASSRGLGPLAAFGALSRRCAHSIAGRMLPNLPTLFLAFSFASVNAAIIGHKKLPKTGLLGKVGMASLQAAVPLARSTSAWRGRSEAFDEWKFLRRRSAAALDGPEILSSQIYSELAMMRAKARWIAHDNLIPALPLSASEQACRQHLSPLVSSVRSEAHDLWRRLDMASAAGVDPWHAPLPGMPDLSELARSLLRWLAREGSPSLEACSLAVDAMEARKEANAISSSIAAPAPAKSTQKAFRL